MVPSEPQNLGPKLSKSLVKNPPGVNKPVPIGGRIETATGGGNSWTPANRLQYANRGRLKDTHSGPCWSEDHRPFR